MVKNLSNVLETPWNHYLSFRHVYPLLCTGAEGGGIWAPSIGTSMTSLSMRLNAPQGQ